jgi:hypothetical protein
MSRAPFAEQLAKLTGIPLPWISDHWPDDDNDDDDNDGQQHILAAVSHDVDQVLHYFETGRIVLSGLDAEDDVEWIYEGRQAVSDVGATIRRAGDVMSHLMSLLETTKEKSSEEGPDTNSYLPIISKIETAIREWHDILELVKQLRIQVDISTEWKDLYEEILTDVSDEIETCCSLIFEIEEKRHFTTAEADIDIDALNSVMDESPFWGRPKLPNLSEAERDVNGSFLELTSRMKPLRASLDFISARLDQYSSKAATLFPSSIKVLEIKHRELEAKCDQLDRDIRGLERELGENRWKHIFRKTGQKTLEMLETLQNNLNVISAEQQKARTGRKVDRVKMDRWATKNGYLMAAIARYISVIDRAVRDRFAVSGEVFAVQARLHQQWSSLFVLAEKKSAELPSMAAHSPCPRKDRGGNDTTLSLSSSTTLNNDSGSSPASSPGGSPVLKAIKLTTLQGLRPAEPAADINPIRGLAIKLPAKLKEAFLMPTSTVALHRSSTTPPSEFLSPALTATTANTTGPSTPASPDSDSMKALTGRLSRQSLQSNGALQTQQPKHSYIPVLSPEKARSARRRSISSMLPRPSSRLDSHTTPTTIQEFNLETPSRKPSRSSSRLSVGSASSSRYSGDFMRPRLSTSRLDTIASTPPPFAPASPQTRYRAPTPSKVVRKTSHNGVLNSGRQPQLGLDRKTSVPGSLHRMASAQNLHEGPLKLPQPATPLPRRPASSRSCHPVSLRPPWR